MVVESQLELPPVRFSLLVQVALVLLIWVVLLLSAWVTLNTPSGPTRQLVGFATPSFLGLWGAWLFGRKGRPDVR